MKIIIQNVTGASCEINNEVYSEIGKGFCIFVSFTNDDTEETIEKMANKLMKLRVFNDEDGKTNLNLEQVNGEILSVSQFTLYASCKGMNRPSFINCLNFDKANMFYNYFNSLICEKFVVKTGIFGADMKIHIDNDGPFTIILDSKEI
ncbi:MAG: D-aminoacyl-tRNA deacylase [Bacilli bacterium]